MLWPHSGAVNGNHRRRPEYSLHSVYLPQSVLNPHNLDMQTFCAQCHAPMSCDRDNGCWCAEFPKVMPVPEDKSQGCLCRECLTKKLALHEISPPSSPITSA
jgi:hypothetical protein